MTHPGRIALVSSSFAPAVGGVEEVVQHLAAGLLAEGHAVEVWTVDREGKSSTRVADGVTVRTLPTPLPARAIGPMASFVGAAPNAWRRWVGAAADFRPDILHVHCFGPNGVYALALHHRLHLPMIVTSHGETIADDGAVFARSALLRAGLRRAMTRASAVTAPSGIVLDDLARNYGLATGVVIPNGVDLSVSAQPKIGGHRYLFAVGRLGRMKGFDLLIRAFAEAEIDPSITLIIGGDGPERARLQGLVESSGLASRVSLVGWMSSQDVADAMAGAVAVVVPSRMEAFGIVALEAWRSGAPLLMTDRGGANSFVRDDEDALLFNPEDSELFTASLHRVVNDARLRERLSLAGRERVADFGWDQVVHRYEAIYASVRGFEEDGGAG